MIRAANMAANRGRTLSGDRFGRKTHPITFDRRLLPALLAVNAAR